MCLPVCCLLQNRTYDRWWQARSAYGGIGGGLTNIVRQISTYTDDPVLIHGFQKWGMCMVYGERMSWS
jgi:predicted membrane chloride channel (bestrophin family)